MKKTYEGLNNGNIPREDNQKRKDDFRRPIEVLQFVQDNMKVKSLKELKTNNWRVTG